MKPPEIAIELVGQCLAGEVLLVTLGDLPLLIEPVYGHVLGYVAQQDMCLGLGSPLLAVDYVLGNTGQDARLCGPEGHLNDTLHT